jgi:hypothetical protein
MESRQSDPYKNPKPSAYGSGFKGVYPFTLPKGQQDSHIDYVRVGPDLERLEPRHPFSTAEVYLFDKGRRTRPCLNHEPVTLTEHGFPVKALTGNVPLIDTLRLPMPGLEIIFTGYYPVGLDIL